MSRPSLPTPHPQLHPHREDLSIHPQYESVCSPESAWTLCKRHKSLRECKCCSRSAGLYLVRYIDRRTGSPCSHSQAKCDYRYEKGVDMQSHNQNMQADGDQKQHFTSNYWNFIADVCCISIFLTLIFYVCNSSSLCDKLRLRFSVLCYSYIVFMFNNAVGLKISNESI